MHYTLRITNRHKYLYNIICFFRLFTYPPASYIYIVLNPPPLWRSKIGLTMDMDIDIGYGYGYGYMGSGGVFFFM